MDSDTPPKKPEDILDEAIAIEKEGYKFYMDAAWRTADERAKNMFEKLAADELEHLKTFAAQKKALEESGSWLAPEAVLAAKEEISAHEEEVLSWKKTDAQVFADQDKKVESEHFDDRNALRAGIDAEVRSIELYSSAASNTDDEQAEGIFTNLAREEEGHKHLLQAELDSLENNGFWFDHQEFSLEID